MWDSKEWKSLDLKKYQSELIKKTKHDNPIIDLIDYKNLKINPNGRLSGIPFGVKDNITIENNKTTSASKILRNYIAPETATVIKKLLEEGAIPLVKTNMDEFGMGGTGQSSNYKPVSNPHNPKAITGGSSSGSTYLVSTNLLPFSLGTDTGDSVRKPASWMGVVGFKPTWGLVSRYGVYDFAPSWDTIAWFSNTVEESALLLEILQGHDQKDFSSLELKPQQFSTNLKTSKKFKIGFIPQLENEIKEEQIKTNYLKTMKKLLADGHHLIPLKPNMDILRTSLTIYRTISSIEAFSSTAAFTGFLYGTGFGGNIDFEKKVIKARTNGFGFEVKKRLLFATEAILHNEKEYYRSMKGRTLIIEELKMQFEKVEIILAPATESYAPLLEDTKQAEYGSIIHDFFTLFNANGSPSISIPTNKDKKKPTGISLAAKPMNDLAVLQVAKIVEGYNG
ncbi:MAG: Asp-tRNA(Asn)/Glu-tRNA(Gln) amidotransferase subunit GatA [Mycoplasmataceae bacterium]|nr:Asp-tRNA(Asn)/Glu-tRNA(Gln) amidotransferase subunit GatA [Mycoplasmataceae bacterium]